MKLTEQQRQAFLAASDEVDFTAPAVAQLAASLRQDSEEATARRCFEWVRDQIAHSIDFKRDELSCSAGEALALGTGLCIAKSHLAVALLRANGIPAGFCYQRLRLGAAGAPYCIHAMIAVWLEGSGWYRCDVRGNKANVQCAFTPGVENLAFAANGDGERLYPAIWAQPWPELVQRLRALDSIGAYLAAPLDVAPPAAAPDLVSLRFGE